MDNTSKNYNPNANVNENCVYEEKEIDIEEDKESNGLVATLLTLGTVGTSVVLIKKDIRNVLIKINNHNN